LAASLSLQIDEMGLYKPRSSVTEIVKAKVMDKFCLPAQKQSKETSGSAMASFEAIEKLCPQPVKVVARDSIAERRTAKLATKGRNVNLSPQKI